MESPNQTVGDLQNKARKNRRVQEADPSHVSSGTSLRMIHPDSKKKTLGIPYPSEIFPTEYNQRLPEWRWRANHSAHQQHWKNWKEFQLAALGATLGLTNVMYFPFNAAIYGKGTYVYAYILIQFLVGFPLLFLQMALGQFTSKCTIRVFSLVPLAQGVGFSFAIMTFITNIISAVQHSWILFYMLSAFSIQFEPTFLWKLPWTNCTWTEKQIEHLLRCSDYDPDIFNQTPNTYCPDKYHHDVIMLAKGDDCLHEDFDFNWRLVGCLILVYLLVFAFVYKGIKGIGKVVKFAVPFAGSCLVIFLLVVILQSDNSFSQTASEALEGMKNLLTPEWADTKSFNFWYQVTRHVITGLQLDKGTMIVIGAYAGFQSSTHYHAFYVCLADMGLSLLAALIVHSHWGIANAELHIDFADFYEKRKRRIEYKFYITILKAIDDMHAFSPLWVLLFFFTLLLLGVMNMVAALLVFFKPICEYFPVITKDRHYAVHAIILLVMFIVTLPFVTVGVTPPMRLIDLFIPTPTKYVEVLLVSFGTVAFVYLYGLNRLRQDIDFMLQFYPNKFFTAMWVSLPIIFLILVLAEIQEPDDEQDNRWSIVLETWIAFVVILLPIPLTAIWNLIRFHRRGELAQLFMPDEEIPRWDISKRDSFQEPLPDSVSDPLLTRQEGCSVLASSVLQRDGPARFVDNAKRRMSLVTDYATVSCSTTSVERTALTSSASNTSRRDGSTTSISTRFREF